MSDSDDDSSKELDTEETVFGENSKDDFSPAEEENSGTPVQESINTPDISTVVPAPEITEENLDVAPSVAQRLLEELFEAGHISNAKMAHLETNYDSLNRFLKSQTERERREQMIVDFNQEENERLQAQLRRFESDISSDESTEVVRTRKKLLAARNTISFSEAKTARLQRHIERMKEEKDGLDIEYTQMSQVPDDTQRMHDLRDACANLRKEIIQQRLDIDTLKDVLQESSKNVAAKKNDLLELERQDKLLTLDAVITIGIPRDLTRQCEKLYRHQSEVKKSLTEADVQLSETKTQATKAQQKLNELALEKRNLQSNLSHLKDEQFSMEKKVADLAKSYEEARIEDIFQTETRANLVMAMEHAKAERRITRHMNFQIASEIDQNLKQVRLEEKHVSVIQEMCLPLVELIHKLNRQLTRMPSRKMHLEKKQALQNEIKEHINTLEKQELLSMESKMQYDLTLIAEKQLEAEIDAQCSQLHDLVRRTVAVNHVIERKSFKIRDASLKCKRLKENIGLKKSQVEDMKKILQNTNQKTADIQKWTEIIKRQTVQLWRLDEATRHKVREMKERRRILASEVKIFAERAASLTRRLENEKIRVSVETESYLRLRSRLTSERLRGVEMADKVKEKDLLIERLKRAVDQLAREFLDMNTRYKSVVLSRNKRGFELAERNEEMCLLFERQDVQAKAIDEAELKLRRKVDEMSTFQVQLVDERRSLEIIRRAIPEHDWHVREIYKLSEELCKSKERLVQLEEEFGNTNNSARVRLLKGTDADPKHMKLKQEHFEVRLTKKDTQLKEKQLVLQRLDQLIGCTKKKIDSSKVEALCVASHVNQLQRNLKRTNRQMMASVAELSIYRAKSLSLSRTMGDQMRVLQEYQSFSCVSDEETDDLQCSYPAEDYNNAERIMDAEAVSLDRHLAVSKGILSSNQRPNAYLSDPMEPCIPRPYGAHGPFMPAQPAPSMRYFRKPNQSNL